MFSAKLPLFIFSLALLSASGARVQARQRLSSEDDESVMRSEWAKKEVFFCLKGGTEEERHWCLASSTQVFAEESHEQLIGRQATDATSVYKKMTDAKECYSKAKPHTVKICDYESSEEGKELNYAGRYLAPKACFHQLGASMQAEGGDTASRITVLKAVADHEECAKMTALPEPAQNEFSLDDFLNWKDMPLAITNGSEYNAEEVFAPEQPDKDEDSEDEDPDTSYSVGKITMVPYVIAKWKRRTFGKDAFTPEQCEKHIMERADAIGYRVNLWLQPFGCGAGPLEEKVLSKDGLKKVCSKHCLGQEELAVPAPDFTDLKRRCRDQDSRRALREAMKALKVHDYLQGIWEACPPAPVEEEWTGPMSIVPYVEPSNYGLPDVSGNSSNDNIIKRKPSDDLVDFVPTDAEMPSRELVPQMIAAKTFADALRAVAEKSCTKLRRAFQEFDYRHTGRLTWKQIEPQLHLMSAYQQKEARDELERVQENAINSDFVTMLDFVNQKLPVTKSLRCYRAYAEGEDDSHI
jgi:hypothetical protein